MKVLHFQKLIDCVWMVLKNIDRTLW